MAANPYSLEGRKALVTGANTGIGQAIAVSLARQGAEVTCLSFIPSDETVEIITKAGGKAESVLADLSDPFAAGPVIKDGGYSILINNAGIIRREDTIDFSEKDWDDVMTINLKAVMFTAQAFAKELLAKNEPKPGLGNIVSTASMLSFQGGIRVPSYTASKHGVAGLTKIFANEWAKFGINANAVAPGYIASDNTAALRADAARSKEILDRIPAGRWGLPSDIGDTVAFLCSPGAQYITGAVLNVDGGWLAR